MGQRLYDSATAEALMKFAYPEYGVHELKPYEIKENGVYITSAFRDLCPPGTVFNWTPADEMGWPGSPNPDTAPFLPIPFDAAQLAAAMIDGAGRSIAYSMEHRLGYPLDDDALNRFSDPSLSRSSSRSLFKNTSGGDVGACDGALNVAFGLDSLGLALGGRQLPRAHAAGQPQQAFEK